MYKYILLAVLVAAAFAAPAQDKGKKVKCVVTNEEGEAIKGAIAVPDGTQDTVTTTAGGAFTLLVAGPVQVAVHAAGYEKEMILVAPDTKCAVQLKNSEGGFDDVSDGDSEE